jgi:hypothetical protein
MDRFQAEQDRLDQEQEESHAKRRFRKEDSIIQTVSTEDDLTDLEDLD